MANLKQGIDQMIKEAQPKKRWAAMPTPELEEKYDDYNDYFADYEPITRSERELNLATGNDYDVYNYVYNNRKALQDRLASGENYMNVLGELKKLGTWSRGKDSWNPKNVRKEYLERLLEGFGD